MTPLVVGSTDIGGIVQPTKTQTAALRPQDGYPGICSYGRPRRHRAGFSTLKLSTNRLLSMPTTEWSMALSMLLDGVTAKRCVPVVYVLLMVGLGGRGTDQTASSLAQQAERPRLSGTSEIRCRRRTVVNRVARPDARCPRPTRTCACRTTSQVVFLLCVSKRAKSCWTATNVSCSRCRGTGHQRCAEHDVFEPKAGERLESKNRGERENVVG
jgi:hypothetical protein